MPESTNRTVLTRREALFLSATAGLSVATPHSALASDSIKTGAQQKRMVRSIRGQGTPPQNVHKQLTKVAAGSVSAQVVRKVKGDSRKQLRKERRHETV